MKKQKYVINDRYKSVTTESKTRHTNPILPGYSTSFKILFSQVQSESKVIQYCDILLCNKAIILINLHSHCALQVENMIA